MMVNSQFCTVFPVVKCVCTFLWDVNFFLLYILALYLKHSILPQLNTPTSIRTVKIAHFISSYGNNMGVSNLNLIFVSSMS